MGEVMKIDYFKKTEKILYNYNYLKANLDFKKSELDELKSEDGIRVVDYQSTPTSKTYKISQPVEDKAILNMERQNSITVTINKLKSKINSIEKSLTFLNNEERKIIEFRYINSMNWIQISQEINISERQAQRIKTKAIDKLKIAFFGLEALEE